MRLASSFAADADGVSHLRMRFEELIAEPDDHLRRIAAFLDLDAADFDRAVFDRKVRGWPHPPALLDDDRNALQVDETYLRLDHLAPGPALA